MSLYNHPMAYIMTPPTIAQNKRDKIRLYAIDNDSMQRNFATGDFVQRCNEFIIMQRFDTV